MPFNDYSKNFLDCLREQAISDRENPSLVKIFDLVRGADTANSAKAVDSAAYALAQVVSIYFMANIVDGVQRGIHPETMAIMIEQARQSLGSIIQALPTGIELEVSLDQHRDRLSHIGQKPVNDVKLPPRPVSDKTSDISTWAGWCPSKLGTESTPSPSWYKDMFGDDDSAPTPV